MIVDTMTHQEIVADFQKILSKHRDKIVAKMDKIVRRFFLQKGGRNKSKKEVSFKAISQKVDNNSTLYVIPVCPDYKTFERMRPQTIFFLTFFKDNKLCVLSEAANFLGERKYNFFTKHLFDRYIERYLSDKVNHKIDLMDAVKHFLEHNPNIVRVPCKMPRYPTNNYIAATDTGGIITGKEIDSSIMEYKTYYGQEKLKDDQLMSALNSKCHLAALSKLQDIIKLLLMKNPQQLKQISETIQKILNDEYNNIQRLESQLPLHGTL